VKSKAKDVHASLPDGEERRSGPPALSFFFSPRALIAPAFCQSFVEEGAKPTALWYGCWDLCKEQGWFSFYGLVKIVFWISVGREFGTLANCRENIV